MSGRGLPAQPPRTEGASSPILIAEQGNRPRFLGDAELEGGGARFIPLDQGEHYTYLTLWKRLLDYEGGRDRLGKELPDTINTILAAGLPPQRLAELNQAMKDFGGPVGQSPAFREVAQTLNGAYENGLFGPSGPEADKPQRTQALGDLQAIVQEVFELAMSNPATNPVALLNHSATALGKMAYGLGRELLHSLSPYGPSIGPARGRDPNLLADELLFWEESKRQQGKPLLPSPEEHKRAKAIFSSHAFFRGLDRLGKKVTPEQSDKIIEEMMDRPDWTLLDIAKWKTYDKGRLKEAKNQFIEARANTIIIIAELFDLPPELLAGTAWNEFGGDPETPDIDDAALIYRELPLGGRAPELTSNGHVSIQIRRVMEELGVKENSFSNRSGIHTALQQDGAFNFLVVAKHLSTLRDLDFKGKGASDLTEEDMRIIGARYNRGPSLPSSEIKKNTSYGDLIIKKLPELKKLLGTQ